MAGPNIEVLGDSGWMEHAACEGADPDLFFPTREDQGLLREAVAICNRCEVKDECLEYALANGQVHGVWGGKNARERMRIKRARRRAR